MANLFKEFQTGKVPHLTQTGIYAVAGTITKVLDDDLLKVAIKVYNKDKGEVVNQTQLLNLAEVGGTEGLKAGEPLVAMCERNEDGDLSAKKFALGNAYLTHNGFGIAAGEMYYREVENPKKGGFDIIASVNVKDNNTERMVKNSFVISGFKDNTAPQERAKKTLEIQTKKHNLEQKSYAKHIFEGYPFDSAITFKENPTINEKTGKRYDDIQEYTPEEGKNAGKTYYSRRLYAQALTSENIGVPMMDLIKERAETSF